MDKGAFRAGIVDVDEIDFEPEFRKLCESNACGLYGKSWMCPPDVGPVEDLIAQAKQFRWALVFQTVNALEDSYDVEGMLAAGEEMNRLTAAVRKKIGRIRYQAAAFAGSGRLPGLSVLRQSERPGLPASRAGFVQFGGIRH